MALSADLSGRRWTRRDLLASLALVLVTFLLYSRTGHFDFVGYDDQLYVTGNPYLTQGITPRTLHWAVTAIAASNYWHPLTLLTELVIATIWGIHPGPFHLVNALLHAANVGMLVGFLRAATGRFWPSFFAAALWGLHPLRVESVAWVAELKDVLCGFMWLLCMLAYLGFAGDRNWRRYLLVLLTLFLALLAKPMAVTLPMVLLLLDYWPLHCNISAHSLRSWWIWRVLEKIPLASVAVTVVGYSALIQVQTAPPPPLRMRLENALVSTINYLRDSFYPRHLGLFYPHPALLVGGHIPGTSVFLAAFLLLAMTAAVLVLAPKHRYLPVGWFWFLGTLLPVIGLVQNGEQARADRYTYLPSIGLTIAVVWLAADLAQRRPATRFFTGVTGATVIVALLITSWVYIGYWKNATTLFTHADQVIPDNYLAKAVLAYEAHLAGDTADALRLSGEAIALSPASPYPRLARGYALLDAGRLDQAAAVLQNDSMSDQTWYALGLVRAAQADSCTSRQIPGAAAFREKACDCFRDALKQNRDFAEAEDDLAIQTEMLGHRQRAIEIWKDLLSRSPAFGPAHGHLGEALENGGDIAAAAGEYQLALDCGQRNPHWEAVAAMSIATSPDSTRSQIVRMIVAATDARDQTGGNDPSALDALAACLARAGRVDDAVNAAEAAVVQAKRLHQNTRAIEIQKRLARYRNGLSAVGENP
jgi:tetratricopeptide (TPR) repeat protein